MNLKESDKEARIDQQEWLILQVTLHIEQLMEKQRVSKAELARRLGTSSAYVTQLLDGTTNMTLKKIADIMLALDSSLIVDTKPMGFNSTISPIETQVSNISGSSWQLIDGQETVVKPDYFQEESNLIRAA